MTPDGSPFRADMKTVGRQGDWESRTDAKVPAPAEIAARLGIAEDEMCVRTAYEFLADGRPTQLSTNWEPYDLTAGSLVVLPEGGPHAGAGVVNRMAAIGISVSHAVEQQLIAEDQMCAQPRLGLGLVNSGAVHGMSYERVTMPFEPSSPTPRMPGNGCQPGQPSDSRGDGFAGGCLRLGFASEARWLRFVRSRLGAMVPYVPKQPGRNKRLRTALPPVKRAIRLLATDTDRPWGGAGCIRRVGPHRGQGRGVHTGRGVGTLPS